MTLTTQNPKEIKSGNGSTTSFSFTFIINQASDLVVIKTTTAGVESTLTEGSGTSNYSVVVSSYPGNGSITFPASGSTNLASGEKLTLKRVVDLDQDTDLVNQGAWRPSQVEDAFDYSRMVDLQQQELMDRSIKFPVSDASLTIELPVAATRAGKYMTFDDSGNVSTTAGASTDASTASTKADEAAASAVTAASEASATAPKYTFSTTTSMADPGTGLLRYNNGTVASVTAIAIDDTTADTGIPDIEAWIASWDDSTSTIKGQIRLVEPGTPANYAVFNITGLTNNSGWVQLAVTHVDSNGTFGNTDSIRVTFSRVGDKGDTGSTGATGSGEGLEMAFESTTTDTDQGAGKVWLNHGTASSATVVYMDDVDSNAVNINSFVDSFDDSGSSVKGRISIKKQLAPENYHIYNVTGSVTSASTYSKVACTHIVSAGTISDADAVLVSFSRTGDKGDTGSTGATGADGDVTEATAVALAIALG